ncbi:PH domain-containing protein [Danxiaibacter flavus]|uniref:PH domain-containing protein n=1 Tax=Danxiaibacter flavus TaxID=3049108 RepID=A0ABV3ZDV3_9BACT|nr:PH domain-containing protein [Chitinophagaceae bacterium DXS]
MINNLKNFLNEEQDPKAVEKVADKLNSMMMTDETVTYIAVQKKPAITIAPECIALTNKRIIFFRSKNMGLSTEYEDIIWKDVLDSHLKENIWGAEFKVQTVKGTEHMIDFLPKAQARKLLAVVQEQEEVQKEVRRQLDLEDKRASANRLVVSASSTNQSTETSDDKQKHADPVETLQKLKTLLDNGLILQEEYDAKKAEVLARM